ncbi:MAG TPA: hypothetical protein VNW92_20225 [Polyangiaceae bacterium]|jgi:hypothetical protein|nr:hypothetical protein [Polyangiaceae bacterium]
MRALVSAACLALFLAPRRAASAPLSATISVERSERARDCPDAPELRSQVERILQRTLPSDPASDELEVQVRFSWTRDQYLANVLSRGPKPGERVLRDRGPNCAALGQAVSVAIALLLDKELQDRATHSSEPARPSNEVQPQPVPAAVAKPERERESDQADALGARAPLALRASLEGGEAAGLLGQSTALLSEQVGLRLQPGLILDAGFSAALPATTHYGPGSVRTTLLFGSARACYVWGKNFSVGPCAAFGVGRLRGVGIGYASVASQSLTWTAVGAGAVAEGPLWGRVFWGLAGTLWLPTERSSFSVQNVGTAWESSRLGGALALRVGFRIW